MAVEALGRGLAGRNTFDAVAWADSLPDAAEKAYAHSAIYDATPRGVGAAISMDNGLPTLRGILPGSPLESSGMRPGDQILEVRQPDGTSQSLYGMPLESAVKLIRGEPGSDLELRILRRNDSSGQLEEHVVPVKRAQLYLNDRAAPKQN
jgi:C-terminal processing protease CtpA/Prc